MSNKTYKVKVDLNNPKETNIKIELNSRIDEMNFLTLKLTQEDLYQTINSDFGVIIGRVIANNGIGVSNAKISIFIPIDENDLNNSVINSIYPYTTVQQGDDNKQYNLLSRVSILDENGNYKPKQPFGSFPTKEEFLTNESFLYVYEKYYKYTTTTNEFGDYMLFGVPIGLQKVHMSVDITDIGKNSMTPMYMVKNLGYSQSLFTQDSSSIIEQKRFSDLPNIELQNVDVNVIPFWGDSSLMNIGITRQDFNIKSLLKSSAVIFGSIATMGEACTIGSPMFNRQRDGFTFLSPDVYGGSTNERNHDIRTLRYSNNLKFRVFTFRNGITKEDINHDLNLDNNLYFSNKKIDTLTDIYELDESEYFVYIEDGFFALNINCNTKRVMTDENGLEIELDDNDSRGVYSEFRGMFIVEIDDPKLNISNGGGTYYGKDIGFTTRAKLKYPQERFSLRGNAGNISNENNVESDKWRKEYFELKKGNLYTISQFFPTRYIGGSNNYYTNKLDDNTLILPNDNKLRISGLFFRVSGIEILGDYAYNFDAYNTINNKPSNVNGGESGNDDDNSYIKYEYLFPYNKKGVNKTAINGDIVEQKYFGGQWINMFSVLPQYTYTNDYTTYGSERYTMVGIYLTGDYFNGQINQDRKNAYFLPGKNRQHVLGNIYGSANFLRGDVFKTDVVEVPLKHISIFRDLKRTYLDADNNIIEINNRAIHLSELIKENKIDDNNIKYRYTQHSNVNSTNFDVAYDNNDVDNKGPYIFKGMGEEDVIEKLYKLNFV